MGPVGPMLKRAGSGPFSLDSLVAGEGVGLPAPLLGERSQPIVSLPGFAIAGLGVAHQVKHQKP